MQKHLQPDFVMLIVFRDKWDRKLTPNEIATEKNIVSVFDGSIGNPLMSMPKYFAEICEADERTYNGKDGDELLS